MEKVRPWCGQPSDRGRLRNGTDRDHRRCDVTLPYVYYVHRLSVCLCPWTIRLRKNDRYLLAAWSSVLAGYTWGEIDPHSTCLPIDSMLPKLPVFKHTDCNMVILWIIVERDHTCLINRKTGFAARVLVHFWLSYSINNREVFLLDHSPHSTYMYDLEWPLMSH